jgi:surface polysaccharide O-acyltransferase-like enzyme
MNDTRTRILWIDIIRIIAIAMVIEMHAGDSIVYLWGKAPIRNGAIVSWWLTGVTFKSIASVCVPLLFMLSGYLLLSSQDRIFTFFKKRLTKIVIPLVVWALLYMWWDGVFLETTSTIKAIKLAIRNILEGNVHYHLWFLYVLLGLYLVTPIMRRFAQSASDGELLFFIGLWLFTATVFYLLQQFKEISISLFAQPYVSGYLGYYVAGYYLGRKEYTRKQVWLAAILFFLIALGRTLWAYYLTYDGGKFDTNLFEFLTWHVIAASLAGFIVLKSVAQYLEKYFSLAAEKIILLVSGATFGIYLVHDQILGIMETGELGFRLTTNIFHPLFATPLTILVAFILSFGVTYLLQKIPVVKLITP